jgi:hypothetical protein
MAGSNKNPNAKDFWEGGWKATRVVLVLRISEDGEPSGLFMVIDNELWNSEAGDGNEPISLTWDSDQGTLEGVMDIGKGDLR